ncbi:MAG: MFS transporter [Chloroflexota bacterium]|nr:MFS transporter [Chloroflexota bacterium]
MAAPALGEARVGSGGRFGGIALPKTFVALRHRNYRLFFAGQLTSLVGTWMQNVAQSWLVYQLTGSPLYLGIVSFASAVPVLFLSLWAGLIVDRVPKRKLLIVTQTSMMVLAFLLSADVFLGWVQPWHIVILSFLLGVANTFDAPARQAFVVDMVARADLQNAIGLNSAIFQMARIIGPTIAGIALAVVGSAWCFFLNGVSFIAVIIGLWLMQVPPTVGVRKGASQLAQIRQGLGYIRHNQVVLTLLGMVAVATIFAFGYSALMPAFAQDVLNSGPAGLGLLSAAVGVGALIGALIVASLATYQHKGMLLTLGNLFFPTMVLLFAVSRIFPVSLLILVGAGLGFMIQNAMTNTLIQFAVPDELRGRVMSIYMLVFQGFFPLGSLMAGTIAQNFGVPIGAAFGGTVALIAGLFWLWRAPYIRKLA